MRCSSYPQNANQVHCQIETNRLPSTAATGSKNHPACRSPKSSKRRTSPKSKSKKKKNACKSIWTEWTSWTTALNQPNHWIHLTKVRSRNENFVREEGRLHELSCGYSRTCAIFFAPRPRGYTKIAIFVLQNVPNDWTFTMATYEFIPTHQLATGSSPHFVVAKARTLPWPSLAAFYWERSSCITGLTGALCTAAVYSLSSLLSFSICFIVSSLVVLSLSNCPHLEQAAFFCHLFYVSLFLSISSSTPLCLWYVHLWSILVIFSHSIGRLPHFYLYFFCLFYFISQRKGPRLASCYWPILFKHICSINK